MSHAIRGMTRIHAAGLVGALTEMGLGAALECHFQQAGEAQLYARGTAPANVILRRDQLRQILPEPYKNYVISDQAFAIHPDGQVESILDNWGPGGGGRGMFNQAWIEQLTQLSGVHAMIAQAQALGHQVRREVLPDGMINVYAIES